MTTTPKLGIQMMSTNMAQKEMVFNEAIIALSSVVAGSVISNSVTTPPGSPADGDTYIVPHVGATGAWATLADQIVFYFNGWQAITPPDHYECWVNGASARYRYTTGGGWVALAAGTPTNLTDLADVNASLPANNDVLTWNAATSKWINQALPAAVTSLAALTDVAVTEGPGIDGFFLKWNNATGKWVAQAVSIPAAVTRLDALTGDVNVTEGAGINGYVLKFDNGTGKWIAANPTSLITVAALNNVGDVTYGGGAPVLNDALVWNGAAWAPSSSAIHFTFEQMTNGPGTMVGAAGKILKVNALETALEYLDVAAAIGGALHLYDLADVAVTEGVGIDTYVLYWDNATSKWKAKALSAANVTGLATVATSGAYADLSGRPTLATVATSGAYADLSGRPTLAAVATSGAYSDLSGTPPPYKIGFFFTTTPLVSEKLLIHVIANATTLPANFSTSVSSVGINPTSSFVLTVKKNGSTVGTITISTLGAVTFATTGGTSVPLVAGDVVEVDGPGVADATVANVAITLIGS